MTRLSNAYNINHFAQRAVKRATVKNTNTPYCTPRWNTIRHNSRSSLQMFMRPWEMCNGRTIRLPLRPINAVKTVCGWMTPSRNRRILSFCLTRVCCGWRLRVAVHSRARAVAVAVKRSAWPSATLQLPLLLLHVQFNETIYFCAKEKWDTCAVTPCDSATDRQPEEDARAQYPAICEMFACQTEFSQAHIWATQQRITWHFSAVSHCWHGFDTNTINANLRWMNKTWSRLSFRSIMKDAPFNVDYVKLPYLNTLKTSPIPKKYIRLGKRIYGSHLISFHARSRAFTPNANLLAL